MLPLTLYFFQTAFMSEDFFIFSWNNFHHRLQRNRSKSGNGNKQLEIRKVENQKTNPFLLLLKVLYVCPYKNESGKITDSFCYSMFLICHNIFDYSFRIRWISVPLLWNFLQYNNCRNRKIISFFYFSMYWIISSFLVILHYYLWQDNRLYLNTVKITFYTFRYYTEYLLVRNFH